ncbi:hypothetical protein CM1200mP19_2510 [bacterium]|nr:MAG: hypothetical protein CM1200mP19_2510 [bacterium]
MGSAIQAGRSLLGLGVGRGDAVGILMPNCIDFVEVMFGGALIGARVVPINARFKGPGERGVPDRECRPDHPPDK